MVSDSIRLPEEAVAVQNNYVLRQEIPALQLVATDSGLARWGPLTRLPRGAELREFGQGFDDRTMLVQFGGCFYIIFQQDLAESQKSAKQQKRAQTA